MAQRNEVDPSLKSLAANILVEGALVGITKSVVPKATPLVEGIFLVLQVAQVLKRLRIDCIEAYQEVCEERALNRRARFKLIQNPDYIPSENKPVSSFTIIK